MIEPVNKYILVEPIEEKKKDEQKGFLLPDDYKKPTNPHKVCEVVLANPTNPLGLSPGERIVVESHMVQEIRVGGEMNYLIQENYVIGVLFNESAGTE
jgi:co-chaperonin GroES (HSP10)